MRSVRGKMSVKDNYKKILKRLAVLFFCSLLLFTASCSSNRSANKYSTTFTDVFDTVTEFTAYCDSQKQFDKAADELHKELLRLHKLYDIYNEYEGIVNLAYMNRVCGTEPVTAGQEILALLEEGLGWCRITGGKMNIFAGSVLSVWHKYRTEGGGVPSDEELREAAEHISNESVVIDGNTVYFSDKDLKIDAGAVAKGMAPVYAKPVIENCGIKDYILNIGGNVVVSGKKADGLWKIGIQDPDGDGLYTKVKVSDVSVVTSGDYQRYYEYNGRKYHHIIDLDTLYPADTYSSVTVICKESKDADALSTALFLLSIEQGQQLLDTYNAEALWIKTDGVSVRSAGFSDYE